jgi:DNA repair protein RadA/Sms
MLAIMSSLRDKIIPQEWIAFGEVGLTGEVRPVYNAIERLMEAQKHGFKVAIIPKANSPKKTIKGLKIVAVEYLYQALQYMSENT